MQMEGGLLFRDPFCIDCSCMGSNCRIKIHSKVITSIEHKQAILKHCVCLSLQQ